MSASALRFSDPNSVSRPDLDIDEHGVPRNPVVFLDSDKVSPETGELGGLLMASPPISVVIARREPVRPELAAAADLVIGVPGTAGTGIESDDPIREAMALRERIDASPAAAVTLAWLLRAGRQARVPEALAAESAAYSMLLGSSQFRTWLSTRGQPRPPDSDARVRVVRNGDLLRVTLARPQRRNAVDTGMRHALLEALRLAQLDERLLVEIDADGPCFSAGGDLDEFGTAADPALAHLIRVSASVGQVIHELRARILVRVHGACIGAGIELPAFAGRVVASPDATFGLPEVAMGLIPGAGGTVSIPARIGRGRTLWLAVSDQRIDAATALAWGLVDELA